MTVEIAAVALVAVLLGALIKSISGIGFPMVTIPLISYVADVETAVAITAVPNLAVNAVLAFQERAHRRHTRDLPILAATGFVGAVFGTLVLVSVPEEPLIALLVLVVVVYAVLFFANPELRLDNATTRRGAPMVGLLAGTLQGAIGISGPVLVSWLHSYRLPRNAHIFAVTTLFAAAGIAQTPTLALSGEMDGRWGVALAACVPALATVPVGTRLRNAISSDVFDRLVVSVLVASALGLAIRTFV